MGGSASLQTLAIESELREVQQRTTELQKKGNSLINQVGSLLQKHNHFLKQNRKVLTDDQQNGKGNLPKCETPVKQNPINFYTELKKDCFKVEIESKDQKKPDDITLTNPASNEASDADEKYLELIDLLTVKMFESDTESGTNKSDLNSKPKKSNSLPRTFDKPDTSLHKSSSQTFLAWPGARPGPSQPGQQLSAYERLFGVPNPSSRSSSPGGREKKKVFIPKASSRVRHTSGREERPGVLDTRRKLEARKLSSRSEENVSTVGRERRGSSTPDRLGNEQLVVEKKKSCRISFDTIDSLFSAPDKIIIPERLQAEEVSHDTHWESDVSAIAGKPCPHKGGAAEQGEQG